MKAVSERHARGGVATVSCLPFPGISLNPLQNFNSARKYRNLVLKKIGEKSRPEIIGLVNFTTFYQILPKQITLKNESNVDQQF